MKRPDLVAAALQRGFEMQAQVALPIERGNGYFPDEVSPSI